MKHIFIRAVVLTCVIISNIFSISNPALANEPSDTVPGEHAGQNDFSPHAPHENTDEDICPPSPVQKLIAITFDDGPGPCTGELLDALKERGAKATFFIFGKKITPENAHLIRQMDADGHCIGSHTYSHSRLTSLTNAQIFQEIEKADDAIAEIIGHKPELLRPPYGSYNNRIIDACGKPLILWSLDTRDWQIDDSKTVCSMILDSVKDGDIILLHELGASSKDGVIAAIDILMDDGYNFVTVPELFEMRKIPLVSGKRYYKACLD